MKLNPINAPSNKVQRGTPTQDPNIPGPCPKGYRPVRGGSVQTEDMLWTPESKSYEKATALELDTPVSSWKLVVRPYVVGGTYVCNVPPKVGE